MLGRLLGVGPAAGVGLTVGLWRWALEMAPTGDFSGGSHEPRAVAAGIGWAATTEVDAENLAKNLVLSGLAEMPVGAGFLRIRGLNRYQRAWEKNNRRKPALMLPVTGTNPRAVSPVPARKTETETEKKEALPESVEPHPLQILWNEHIKPPCPRWTKTKGPRRTHADARRRENPQDPFWLELFERINASDFLAGRKTDFVASPDWILNPTNLTKVLEGNYDNRATAPPSRPAPVPVQTTLAPYPEEFR